MGQAAVIIPEKIYFKIGEVCDLVGVQPHVLRYWETEFPMLSPQKNRSGQRSYRRRDVEMECHVTVPANVQRAGRVEERRELRTSVALPHGRDLGELLAHILRRRHNETPSSARRRRFVMTPLDP